MATVYTFQSTLSVRRATGDDVHPNDEGNISIHALREESDSLPRIAKHIQPNFNPRSP